MSRFHLLVPYGDDAMIEQCLMDDRELGIIIMPRKVGTKNFGTKDGRK
jgi:hypothetical protein